jgi:hypothetical protein
VRILLRRSNSYKILIILAVAVALKESAAGFPLASDEKKGCQPASQDRVYFIIDFSSVIF